MSQLFKSSYELVECRRRILDGRPLRPNDISLLRNVLDLAWSYDFSAGAYSISQLFPIEWLLSTHASEGFVCNRTAKNHFPVESNDELERSKMVRKKFVAAMCEHPTFHIDCVKEPCDPIKHIRFGAHFFSEHWVVCIPRKDLDPVLVARAELLGGSFKPQITTMLPVQVRTSGELEMPHGVVRPS